MSGFNFMLDAFYNCTEVYPNGYESQKTGTKKPMKATIDCERPH